VDQAFLSNNHPGPESPKCATNVCGQQQTEINPKGIGIQQRRITSNLRTQMYTSFVT